MLITILALLKFQMFYSNTSFKRKFNIKTTLTQVNIGNFQFKIGSRKDYFYERFRVVEIMLFYLTQKLGHVSLRVDKNNEKRIRVNLICRRNGYRMIA